MGRDPAAAAWFNQFADQVQRFCAAPVEDSLLATAALERDVALGESPY